MRSPSKAAASSARFAAISASACSSGSKSGGKRALAIVEANHIALLHARAEGNDGAVHPHLCDDGFARKNGRREAHIEPGDFRRIVVADRAADYGTARRAIGAKPMKNWARKSGHPRHFGIAMQRIAIARQGIEERLIEARIGLVRKIGFALGNWM